LRPAAGLEVINSLFKQPAVQLIPHRRNVAGLFRAEQVACAAKLKVTQRNAKARTKHRE
jgi:hypothetical protein